MPRCPCNELDTGESARSAEQRRRRTICVDADHPWQVCASAGKRQCKLGGRSVALRGPDRGSRAAVGAHEPRLGDRGSAPAPAAFRRRREIALQNAAVPGEPAAPRCRHERRHPGPRDDRDAQAAGAALRLESDMTFFGRVGELILERESRRCFHPPRRQRRDSQRDESAMVRSDHRFPARSGGPCRGWAAPVTDDSACGVEYGPRHIAARLRRIVDQDAQRGRRFCH